MHFDDNKCNRITTTHTQQQQHMWDKKSPTVRMPMDNAKAFNSIWNYWNEIQVCCQRNMENGERFSRKTVSWAFHVKLHLIDRNSLRVEMFSGCRLLVFCENSMNGHVTWKWFFCLIYHENGHVRIIHTIHMRSWRAI